MYTSKLKIKTSSVTSEGVSADGITSYFKGTADIVAGVGSVETPHRPHRPAVLRVGRRYPSSRRCMPFR